MILFKDVINQNIALRFVYEDLEIQSSLSKQRLLETPFMVDPELLIHQLDSVDHFYNLLGEKQYYADFIKIKHELFQLHNILNTLQRLESGAVLDDVELYEIKRTCFNIQIIATHLAHIHSDAFSFGNMTEVISILDPDKTNLPYFYIYPSYNQELAKVRELMKVTEYEEEKVNLQVLCSQMEDEIRTRLSQLLRPFAPMLIQNLEMVTQLDLDIAKADFARRWHCCRPKFSDDIITFKALFHPLVKFKLEKEKRMFQPIDIELFPSTALITGANMSGKTIFLKSVALAQYLFQFGFFVPAESAEMFVVDDVLCSIGDNQSEVNGLSSFCVEILNINKIINQAKNGDKLLILVDELARTTNPAEGTAIVAAFVEIMQRYPSVCLITTHYDISDVQCRRLRVKGLNLSAISGTITPFNINNYMDYSLLVTDETSVPTEALNIARIFNVDEEFLGIASSLFSTSDNP